MTSRVRWTWWHPLSLAWKCSLLVSLLIIEALRQKSFDFFHGETSGMPSHIATLHYHYQILPVSFHPTQTPSSTITGGPRGCLERHLCHRWLKHPALHSLSSSINTESDLFFFNPALCLSLHYCMDETIPRVIGLTPGSGHYNWYFAVRLWLTRQRAGGLFDNLI